MTRYMADNGVCLAHGVHLCEACFTDELCTNPPLRPTPIPRNLREPTERRCHFWWADFTRMWRRIGTIHALHRELQDVLDEVRKET